MSKPKSVSAGTQSSQATTPERTAAYLQISPTTTDSDSDLADSIGSSAFTEKEISDSSDAGSERDFAGLPGGEPLSLDPWLNNRQRATDTPAVPHSPRADVPSQVEAEGRTTARMHLNTEVTPLAQPALILDQDVASRDFV